MKQFVKTMLVAFAAATVSVGAAAAEYKGPNLSGQTVTCWPVADCG